MIECQVNFVVQIIGEVLRRSTSTVEVKSNVETKWVEYTYKDLDSMVWASTQCGAWYVDHKGRPTTMWPKSCIAYYLETRKVDFNKFIFSQ